MSAKKAAKKTASKPASRSKKTKADATTDTAVAVTGGVLPTGATLEAPADVTSARVNTDGARRAEQ